MSILSISSRAFQRIFTNLQNLASTQKRTSPIKFDHLAEKSDQGSISNLSTKVVAASRTARTTEPEDVVGGADWFWDRFNWDGGGTVGGGAGGQSGHDGEDDWTWDRFDWDGVELRTRMNDNEQ